MTALSLTLPVFGNIPFETCGQGRIGQRQPTVSPACGPKWSHKAGAAHVYAVDYVGEPDSKQGAADLNSVGIELHLRAERLETREWSAQSFRLVPM